MRSLTAARIHPLDRLDDQTGLIRLALLHMAVANAVPSPTLRLEAFNACVSAGLLVSPIATFKAEFDAVIRHMVYPSGSFGGSLVKG